VPGRPPRRAIAIEKSESNDETKDLPPKTLNPKPEYQILRKAPTP